MRVLSFFVSLVLIATTFVGCKSRVKNSLDGVDKSAPTYVTEVGEQSPKQDESKSETAKSKVYKSKLGYSLTYNPSVFTLDNTSDAERFTYNVDQNPEEKVYISVGLHPNDDVEFLAVGLALQSDIDDVTLKEGTFGQKGVKSMNVYYEKEVDGIKKTFEFFVFSSKKGSIVVESVGYAGMPQNVRDEVEKMLKSFTV